MSPTVLDALKAKLEAEKIELEKLYPGHKDPFRYRYTAGRIDQINTVLDFLRK